MFNLSAALVFARQMVGSPYVYGATGKLCTPALRRMQAKQYPSAAENIFRYCPVLSLKAAACQGCRWQGRPAFDCAQLVRFILKAGGMTAPSGASTLWKTAHLWQHKAAFDAPYCATHPCVVFRRQQPINTSRPMAHVGFSLGDGTFVDARGHKLGVVLSSLRGYPWSDYAIPVGLPARGAQGAAARAITPGASSLLQMGSRGPLVKQLQKTLLALGFPLPRFGADGIFGQETRGALLAFQKSHRLSSTGRLDSDTSTALLAISVTERMLIS